jgi:hypothetical protein
MLPNVDTYGWSNMNEKEEFRVFILNSLAKASSPSHPESSPNYPLFPAFSTPRPKEGSKGLHGVG